MANYGFCPVCGTDYPIHGADYGACSAACKERAARPCIAAVVMRSLDGEPVFLRCEAGDRHAGNHRTTQPDGAPLEWGG